MIGVAAQGCAEPRPGDVEEDTVSGPVVAYQDPPPQISETFLSGTRLTVTQSAWRTPQGYQLAGPDGDQEIPQTVLDWPGTGRASFVLRTSVRSTRVSVTVFDGLDLEAAPDDEDGEELDCTSSPSCSLQAHDDQTAVVLAREVDLPAALVLDVGYATMLPVDEAEGVASYSASWVVRARTGPT